MTEGKIIRQAGSLDVPAIEPGVADPVALAGQVTEAMFDRWKKLHEQGTYVEKASASAEFRYGEFVGTMKIEVAFRHKSERVQ